MPRASTTAVASSAGRNVTSFRAGRGARPWRPLATRSVRNDAPHFGHGSLIGRCQTTNLQFGYAEQPKKVRPFFERRSTSSPAQPGSGHLMPRVTGLVVLHSGYPEQAMNL